MPFAALDQVRLFYERAGSGEPELLFVPGWCCDHAAFQPQFEHFAQAHAVTALEPYGCGQSDAPEDGYAIRDFADDLAELCSAVGFEKLGRGHGLPRRGARGLDRRPHVPRSAADRDRGDPWDERLERKRGPRDLHRPEALSL